MQVSVGDVNLFANNSYYHYKRYIEDCLSYNTSTKTSVLESGGYYQNPDDKSFDEKEGAGFDNRMKPFIKVSETSTGTKTWEFLPEGGSFLTPLNCGLDCMLLNGLSLKVIILIINIYNYFLLKNHYFYSYDFI